jgi:hypothetical protein
MLTSVEQLVLYIYSEKCANKHVYVYSDLSLYPGDLLNLILCYSKFVLKSSLERMSVVVKQPLVSKIYWEKNTDYHPGFEICDPNSTYTQVDKQTFFLLGLNEDEFLTTISNIKSLAYRPRRIITFASVIYDARFLQDCCLPNVYVHYLNRLNRHDNSYLNQLKNINRIISYTDNYVQTLERKEFDFFYELDFHKLGTEIRQVSTKDVSTIRHDFWFCIEDLYANNTEGEISKVSKTSDIIVICNLTSLLNANIFTIYDHVQKLFKLSQLYLDRIKKFVIVLNKKTEFSWNRNTGHINNREIDKSLDNFENSLYKFECRNLDNFKLIKWDAHSVYIKSNDENIEMFCLPIISRRLISELFVNGMSSKVNDEVRAILKNLI